MIECNCYAKFAKTEAETKDHHPLCSVALRRSAVRAAQRELLDWASEHPGVLSLLEALRAANYDESGTEYLRRVVAGTGMKGERCVGDVGGRCANCGESFSAGKHVARGVGVCEVPT
jgi:hypothetical protein